MASAQPGPAVLRGIQQLFGPGTASGLSEWQLLDRYASRRDEAAFEALVARHGPMVLGVCRRLLRDPADVDDAFQATFLVLVRKAGSLGERDVLARWLYGVAHRVALRARSDTARRRARELAGDPIEPAMTSGDPERDELGAMLLDEVRRLPEKYRSPVVLCYLEGRTHEQAAAELRWPVGTVKGRLSRARDRLRGRLARRGATPSAVLLVQSLTGDASAAIPPGLLAATARSARAVATRGLAAGAVSPQVSSLAQGLLRSMTMTKLMTMGAAALLAAGLLGTGGAIRARQVPAPRPVADRADPGPGTVAANEAGTSVPAPPEAPRPPTTSGDSSPGASTDARVKLAETIFNNQMRRYLAGELEDPEVLDRWSHRILLADVATRATPAARVAAAEAHLDRMRSLAGVAQARTDAGRLSKADAAIASYFLVAAEAEVARERAGPPAGRDLDPGAKAGKAGDGSSRSRAIQAKLDSPIAITFRSETPLEDVIKYIKQATAGGDLPQGLPIYVDPVGLQEADKTLASTVQIDLEGLPVRRALGLMMDQLGLRFTVDDGLLIISSGDRIGQLKGAGQHQEPAPFVQMQEKLERGEYTIQELAELKKQLTLKNEVERLIQGEMPGDPKDRNQGVAGAKGR